MPKPEVSVVIPAFNEEKNIRACLDAVFAQEIERTFEVIVVDSGSTDKTVEIVKRYDAKLYTVPRSEFSHGRTRQFACEKAQGEFLVALVADARPADKHWLRSLVEAVARDDMVAGAYSRQVPREEAGPVEAYKLGKRIGGGTRRITRSIASQEKYWSMKPEERLQFCKFDDVSACRRRSVWKKLPIPDVAWAEDLAWSKSALMQGYKIVFEPSSVVVHSHAETLWHSMRRAYMDQTVVRDWFGVIYYADLAEALRAYGHMLVEQHKAIMAYGRGRGLRMRYALHNPLRLCFEIAGSLAASRDRKREHTVLDLASNLGRAGLCPSNSKSRIMRTRFPIGQDRRPVIFMNPNSAAVFKVRVPRWSRLAFGTALNPEASPLRKEPVRFIVGVEGKPIFDQWIKPQDLAAAPRWDEAEISLDQWAGREVLLSLITSAEFTDNAWAGWGAPRIVIQGLTVLDKIYNALVDSVHRKFTGTPLRHP